MISPVVRVTQRPNFSTFTVPLLWMEKTWFQPVIVCSALVAIGGTAFHFTGISHVNPPVLHEGSPTTLAVYVDRRVHESGHNVSKSARPFPQFKLSAPLELFRCMERFNFVFGQLSDVRKFLIKWTIRRIFYGEIFGVIYQ